NKVSIIGVGAVGMAAAITILTKKITNHLALVDINRTMCESERLDLLHGSMFANSCRIESGNMSVTKNSRVVLMTAGPRPDPNLSRMSVAKDTIEIIKSVMPAAAKHSPKGVFIILSEPVDVMTWVAQKITKLPYEQIFGTGCHLDTARFRAIVGQQMNISPCSINGYVVGEHGESLVPLWSSLTIGGVRLMNMIPNIGTEQDPMRWSDVRMDVVNAALKVKEGKGYTNWAIALSVADIISAIFDDSYRVISLSTNVAGMCGIEEDMFLSLPCILNRWGICGIVRPILTDWEKRMFLNSASVIRNAQTIMKF
ncbi:ImpL3, partial [Drosophila busckii]